MHKEDVVVEEEEEDASMPDVADIVGPLRTPEDSSSSMEKNIATLTRRMEEMYNLQAIRHHELLYLHGVQDDQVYGLIRDIDHRLTNIKFQLEEHYADEPNDEFKICTFVSTSIKLCFLSFMVAFLLS